MPTIRAIILGKDGAPHGRLHSQHGKKILRNTEPVNDFRSASFRPRWRPFLVERNGLQGAATRFPIRRRSVRNFARVRRLSITFREGDKAIRLMIRKRIEEHRINHAEKRRVRSDAQGQSYHRDDGERRALTEHSHAIVQILPERLHQLSPLPRTSVIF